MKDILKKGLFVILIVVFLYFISWIMTCGIIKLITMCFGFGFSWLVATGIWLIMCIVQSMLKGK